ncbi:MAG: NUDIX hydrolase [Candidatus Binataceae bacterium]
MTAAGNIRDTIAGLVSAIAAHDATEASHKARVLDWIASGAPLFRIQKPDVPKQHLVSYFVLADLKHRKILLVDHKSAGLWLPSGGHVEPDEDPEATVHRELAEELRLAASFICKGPFFLTITRTIGIDAGHDDVSLWYVLSGDSESRIWFDENEFNAIRWFSFDEIPFDRSDPQLRRFMDKLEAHLGRHV